MAPPIATVDHNAIQYSDDGAVLAGSDRLQSPVLHDCNHPWHYNVLKWHPPLSALCIVHCALCIVHCALCIVHCALCIVHKIDRPAQVKSFRYRQRWWVTGWQALFPFAANIEFQEAIDTVYPFSDLLHWQGQYAGRSLNMNGTIMQDDYIPLFFICYR